MTATEFRIAVDDRIGHVGARLDRPTEARFLLAFAHGAGAGMQHPFMADMSAALGAVGVATLRFQFPYMDAGKGAPDRQPVLLATVRAALKAAHDRADGLPVLAGGKSMGGRMTSLTAAEFADDFATVRGLIFFGFPLHPAGKPGTARGEHLSRVNRPMLFLQGTRDTLADLNLLSPICETLGPRATLHILDGADHGFHVLKRSGKTDAEIIAEIAREAAAWADSLPAPDS